MCAKELQRGCGCAAAGWVKGRHCFPGTPDFTVLFSENEDGLPESVMIRANTRVVLTVCQTRF